MEQSWCSTDRKCEEDGKEEGGGCCRQEKCVEMRVVTTEMNANNQVKRWVEGENCRARSEIGNMVLRDKCLRPRNLGQCRRTEPAD